MTMRFGLDISDWLVGGVASVLAIVPRTASAMEGGAQGADILTFTITNGTSPGAISLTNVEPAGAVQMNADGRTLEYGPTAIDRDTTTTVSFTANFTDNSVPYAFGIALAVQRIGLPAGGDLFFDVDVTGDEDAPIITLISAAKAGTDGFTGSVTTDTGSGSIKYVVIPDSSPTPTEAQILAGQDGTGAAAPGGMRTKAVSASGAQALSGTGLSGGAIYRLAALHEDAGTNRSDVYPSNPFTTDAAASTFTTVAGQLTNFNDLVNWPTGNGKATFAVLGTLTNTGGSQYLFEMGNIHFSLECTSSGLLRVTVKDSASTTLLSSVGIGTITFGTEFEAIIAIDLAALTVWTTFNGTTTARSVAANSGALASASRKLRCLARATAANYAIGTFKKVECWTDSVSGGGRPPTDAALRTNGRITGPAATANAHPWKLGGDTT